MLEGEGAGGSGWSEREGVISAGGSGWSEREGVISAGLLRYRSLHPEASSLSSPSTLTVDTPPVRRKDSLVSALAAVLVTSSL